MRKSYSLIILSAILSACGGCSSDSSNNISTEPDSPTVEEFQSSLDLKNCIVEANNKTLEIVTWNIEHFPKTESTLQEVAHLIKRMNVDVIALQEIKNRTDLQKLAKLLPGYNSKIMLRSDANLAFLYKTSEITLNGNAYSIYNEDQYHSPFPRRPFILPFTSRSTGLEIILVNNHYKAFGENKNVLRRKAASKLLKQWVDTEHPNDNIVIVGDFNDILTDKPNENVFQIFLEDTTNYIFADMDIANDKSQWSYPSSGKYFSHIDHVLITDELFDNEVNTYTYTFQNCDKKYDSLISDHQPVCIVLK